MGLDNRKKSGNLANGSKLVVLGQITTGVKVFPNTFNLKRRAPIDSNIQMIYLSPTPTSTPQPSNTTTPTLTPTNTPTLSPTPTPTLTPTNTPTLSPTSTPTLTPTNTLTPTPSITQTNTPTPTITPTNTPTLTPTNTPTLTPTNTPTPSPSPNYDAYLPIELSLESPSNNLNCSIWYSYILGPYNPTQPYPIGLTWIKLGLSQITSQCNTYTSFGQIGLVFNQSVYIQVRSGNGVVVFQTITDFSDPCSLQNVGIYTTSFAYGAGPIALPLKFKVIFPLVPVNAPPL